MKYILVFLQLSICWFSCSSPGAKAPVGRDSSGSVPVNADSGLQTVSAASPPAFMKLDTVVPFSGYWVNLVYVQRIRHSRSPSSSQNVAESSIIIPPRTLQVTRMIGGFHEGAADMVVVKDGSRYTFYAPDGSLFMKDIEPVVENQIRIGDQDFIRLEHPDTTLYDWGILEQYLFQGKYVDQLGRSVVFSSNGRVTGLEPYRYYVPQIDYSEMAGPVDHVQLGHSPRQMDDFGFRFAGDSLIIYAIRCASKDQTRDCDSERLGERMYTLVREAATAQEREYDGEK